MIQFFVNLLFFDTSRSRHIAGLRFLHLATALDRFLFLLAGGAGMALVIWFYRREPSFVTPKRKAFLASLRIGAMLLLLFMASGAVAMMTRVSRHKGVLAVLVDRSASMGIVPRPASARQTALEQKILGRVAARDLSRTALLQGAFANPKQNVAPKLAKTYHVKLYAFGQSSHITPLPRSAKTARENWLANLKAPTQTATQLGAAIAAAARRQRGRRLAGIVVFTDGGWNRGQNPITAAKAAHVPVYAVGVGLPASRDVSIPFVSCNPILFKHDTFPLLVRIKNRGYAGQPATLTVSSVNSHGRREVIKRQTIVLGPNGESTRVVRLMADHAGLFTYQAALAPMPGEVDTANNHNERANVRVINKKMRVLLVDSAPDWNFRYIHSVMQANRRRIAGTVYLRYGSEAGRGMAMITHFPSSARQINDYDAIILGDISPRMLDAAQYRLLENWIKTGGGLMVVAGPNYMPRRCNAALRTLLPVIPGRLPQETLRHDLRQTIAHGFRPRRTAAGRAFAPLSFSPDPARNAMDWARVQKIFWDYPVRRLKPAAQSLLVNPRRRAGGHAMPVLATQRYGEGKVMFFATDESWRWRTRPGPRAFDRVWAQLISNLAMTHLLGNAGRTSLEIDKNTTRVGRRVHLLGRVLTAGYSPLAAPAVIVRVRHALQQSTVTLRADRQTQGVFHGTFVPRAPGRYRLHLPGVSAGSRGSTVILRVKQQNLEMAHPRMRVGLLKQVAHASGGAYVPLWHLRRLPALLKSRQRTRAIRKADRTLWNAPLVVVLLALCLGVEWFFRKRFDLL